MSVVLKGFGMNYTGIYGVNAVHSKFMNLSSQGNGIVLTGRADGSVFDRIQFIIGRYGILTTNADGSVFHDINLRMHQLPFVVNGGSGVTVDNLWATVSTSSTNYAIYDLAADVSMHGILVDRAATAGWKGAIVADHPTAPFRLFKGDLGLSATPAVASITVDSGMGYVVEGTSFGLSHTDAHVIHVNAPLAASAQHVAYGIHYDTGSIISDDPDIQLLGSGSN